MRGSLHSAAVGLALLVFEAQAVRAAVRVCLPVVAGAERSGASETEARRKALEAWSGVARTAGEGFTQWRTANAKSVVCRRSGVREFVCAARAAPCRISQVPVPPVGPKGSPGRVPRPKLLDV